MRRLLFLVIITGIISCSKKENGGLMPCSLESEPLMYIENMAARLVETYVIGMEDSRRLTGINEQGDEFIYWVCNLPDNYKDPYLKLDEYGVPVKVSGHVYIERIEGEIQYGTIELTDIKPQ